MKANHKQQEQAQEKAQLGTCARSRTQHAHGQKNNDDTGGKEETNGKREPVWLRLSTTYFDCIHNLSLVNSMGIHIRNTLALGRGKMAQENHDRPELVVIQNSL